MRVHLWEPSAGKGHEVLVSSDDKPVLVGSAILSGGDTLEISSRLALGLDGIPGTRQIASITLDGRVARIRAADKGPYRLISQDGKQVVNLSTGTVSVPMTVAKDSWMLHFGPVEKLHRFAVFELRTEVHREGK